MCPCGGEMTDWCFDCGDYACDDCGCPWQSDHEATPTPSPALAVRAGTDDEEQQ